MIGRVPPATPFISYAQNREDVILWRALGHVQAGCYVEVGANHPTDDSVTRAFYDRGWSGITVEPVPYFADLHREQRPRDTLVEAAVTERGEGEISLHVVPGTGLSTIVDAVSDRHAAAGIEHVDLSVPAIRLETLLAQQGWTEDQDIHFLLVDVEGAERDVVRSIDLRRWRPWVLVIEATAPNSNTATHGEWEPDVLAAGYEFCIFDGLSRYYVAAEHAEELRPALSYPACVLDGYVPYGQMEALEKADDLLRQTIHWRTLALTNWADALSRQVEQTSADQERAYLREELAAMQQTISWRITQPLRVVRPLLARVRAR